jgi:hypothetical protein
MFPFHYAAMEDAFEQAGCPVCSVLRRMEERSIFSFLYEGMMNSSERQRFVDGGGFCPKHFRVVAGLKAQSEIGNFEIGALFQSLLLRVGEGLERVAGKKHATNARERKRSTKVRRICIFCSEGLNRESGLIEAIEHLLDEEAFKQQLAEHFVCWRHSLMGWVLWRDMSKREWLLAKTRTCTTSLRHRLEASLVKQEDINENLLRRAIDDSVQFLAAMNPAKAESGYDFMRIACTHKQ